MKWSEWSESFAIFAKYGDEAEAVASQHDSIIAGPTEGFGGMEEPDAERLAALGWYEDIDSGLGHLCN